jgi:hypothetical protein
MAVFDRLEKVHNASWMPWGLKWQTDVQQTIDFTRLFPDEE